MDARKPNEIASAANIPVDCKAGATSKTNNRHTDLSTRTHGMGDDTRKPYSPKVPTNPSGCC